MAEYIERGTGVSIFRAKAMQTVDAVPVVRCRDCRKFKTYGCRMVASGYDDFCSYGERKEGAEC